MIDANFFLGYPASFKEICNVYPPKVKEILSDKQYSLYRKILLLSQEDLEDQFTEMNISLEDMPTPYEHLFNLIESSEKNSNLVRDSFQFFIHEPVTFLKEQKMIIIGDLMKVLPALDSMDQLRILKEEDYFDFQNLLRAAVGEKQVEPYNPDEHPKIKYFKAKARLRDKVKANSKDALTLGSTLASICCMNFGLNPLNIGELSQCAISTLIRYYQEKDKYEIDIQSLLAGADSNKIKPKNWIRNIEDL